ncbi:MAG TPA: fibronectin type III domain-containing protein, partial [Jatrophihabitantaceae bacterium]|nr:fibronectin type III domain-containing protein [Jatrophihabitantaceae bacterium]
MARSGQRSVTWWATGLVTCLVLAGATGLGGRVPALALRQSGHWVYNSTIGAVLHVNGASKNVDSKMPLPGLGPADQVVQDDKNGYVIDHRGGRILVFGKSTLSVGTTLSTGTSEQPISLEVPGGPYLIYPHGGTIVRLGTPAATIAADGPLAAPTATSDGTVWVQRTNTGSLCKLAPKSNSLSCPARVPAGHHGTLTTLDDRPAFVDQAAGSIRPIQSGGLGPPAPVAPGLPTKGQVASSDAGGRLPVVTPAGGGGSSLVLVDTSTVASGRTGAAPITVPLGAGQFDVPVTTGGAIVLVNRSARQIVTYSSTGARTAIVTVPAAAGTLHVSRGEDGRVYIDNAAGTQTFIVDGDGSVARASDNDGPAKSTGPAGPPTTPPGPPSGAPGTPAPPTTRPPTKPTPPPAIPNPPPPSPTPTPPAHPPTPTAQVPDAPATVTASAGDGQVTVNWTTPADNGAALTSYLVSWPGGSTTVSAGARQTTVSGLADGTSYVMR